MGRKIVWPEVYSRLPWVTRLKKGQPCTAIKSGAPLKLYHPNMNARTRVSADEYQALREKYACKNTAHWKFRSLRRSFAKDGVYCWSHLVFRGIAGDMDEEARTARWLKRYDPKSYEAFAGKSADA